MRRKSKERTFPLRNENPGARRRRPNVNDPEDVPVGRTSQTAFNVVSFFVLLLFREKRGRIRTFEKIKPLQFLSLIVFHTKRREREREKKTREIKVLLDEAGNETNYIHTYIHI